MTIIIRTPGFWKVIVGWFVLIASFSGPALAQTVRLELYPLPTTTLSDSEFLTGTKEGKATIVAGELRLPRAESERLPAVLLLHGSGGVDSRETSWANHLNKLRIATFTLDSFTGRGITRTGENQALLARLAMVVDAYRALELLAKHPRIDPTRIAIMGFSRGAQATLYASLKRFRRMHGPAGLSSQPMCRSMLPAVRPTLTTLKSATSQFACSTGCR